MGMITWQQQLKLLVQRVDEQDKRIDELEARLDAQEPEKPALLKTPRKAQQPEQPLV